MKLTSRIVFLLLCIRFSLLTFSQQVSIDIQKVIREIPSHAVGINMNYLMDGTFISAAAQTETSKALKEMGVKFLRYPGGEKSDNYLFSVPPYTNSSPRMALAGSCPWPSKKSEWVESDKLTAKENVLDFDEFMVSAQNIGAEPMIVVAYDAIYYTPDPIWNCTTVPPTLSELVTHATEWVRYANITKGYGIKYWCIGNESWGSADYNGNVSPAQYALDIVAYATAMKAVDPSIKIIVNGRGESWWKTLLESPAASYIDYFGVSCYPIWNFTGGYEQYRTTAPNLLAEAQTAVNAINNFASATDKQRIKVMSTEFNAIDFNSAWPNNNDLGHALVAFETMGQHLENPMVDAALLWNTRWVNNMNSSNNIDDVLNSSSHMNANGLALSIWGNGLLPKFIESVRSGSGSEYLRSYAVYDETFNKLNVFVINKDNIQRTIDLTINNYSSLPFCTRFEFSGTGITDVSPVYTQINPMSDQVIGYPYTNTVSANSITLFQFEGYIVLPENNSSIRVRMIDENQSEIKWITKGDCNAVYTLQRSVDGKSWQNKESLKDDCLENDLFTFIDQDLISIQGNTQIYYRVQIKDPHGRITYSQVKNLSIPKPVNLSFSISPNPVSNVMMLNIESGDKKNGVINILTSEGKKIMSSTIYPLVKNLQINTSQLPAGIYIVEMVSGDEKITKKMFRK